MRRILVAGAVLSLVGLTAAGCGGGKKAHALTKQQYASALNKICLIGSDQLRELHLDNTMGAFKARGDHIVRITENATKKFEALTPSDDVKDAADRFNAANDSILADTKDAVSAAKAGDQTKFKEALSQADADNTASLGPAKEIGATSCY